mmetsp:Transcript_142276/g.258562  ORF Transcript_142276/g.258562 Transcript_142276/m.258562 type:complete len:530 (-) Transcript_142276:74-1663(-)
MDSAVSESASDDASPDSEAKFGRKPTEEQQLKAVANDQLRSRLLERLRRSDGEKDGNCFIRHGTNSDATFREGEDVEPIQEAEVEDEGEDVAVNDGAATEFDHILCGKLPQRRLALEKLMREMAEKAGNGTHLSPKSQKSLTSPKSADAAAGTAAADKTPHCATDSRSRLNAATDATCDASGENGGEAATPSRAVATTSPAAASGTPHESQGSRTPGTSRGGVNVMSPSDLDPDEAESLQYEWQFEILNNMPREKAIALVDHLKNSERDRAQATAATAQLRREVKELEQQLQAKGMQKGIQCAGFRECALSRPGRRCRCICGLLMLLLRLLALALLAAAAGAVALQSAGVAPGSHFMDHIRRGGVLGIDRPELRALAVNAAAAADNALANLLPRGSFTSSGGCKVDATTTEAPRCEDWSSRVQLLGFQLEESRRKLEVCEAKLQAEKVAIATSAPTSIPGGQREQGVVRKTAVREMNVSQNTTGEEFDPETLKRITEEHKVMKAQFDMLQNDIDDALHKGRNTVCWPIT